VFLTRVAQFPPQTCGIVRKSQTLSLLSCLVIAARIFDSSGSGRRSKSVLSQRVLVHVPDPNWHRFELKTCGSGVGRQS
jgi:hypothetical protein